MGVTIVLLGFLTLISSLVYVWNRFFSTYFIPSTIPWAGGDGYLNRAHATARSLFHTRDLLQEGYDKERTTSSCEIWSNKTKYSRANRPFVLPNITTGPEIIIPASQMEWLLRQPDNFLSQHHVNQAFLQAKYTMLHPKIITDYLHDDVIRKEMTKLTGNYIGDVQEEVDYAFKKNWGTNTEWKEVGAYETMLDIITRISNRVLVGLPLCRNEEYLENSGNFARLVVLRAAFLAMLPQFMRSALSSVVNFFDNRRYLNCAKFIIPMIKERFDHPLDSKRNDYVQWCIEHSYRKKDPSERTEECISKRLNVLSFAAIHSSTITMTNLILDLAGSSSVSSYLAAIRSQVKDELREHGGVYTKTALDTMYLLDSTIRESMRLWGFVSRGLLKEVIAEDGLTLPSGERVPKGLRVGSHAYPIHHDADIYPEPYTFKPFRYTDQRMKLVTTTSKFMAFSHGKHACPGRYFAAQQMKLVLAYVALNYDIDCLESRPDNLWFVGSQGPPMDFKVRIRRRDGT